MLTLSTLAFIECLIVKRTIFTKDLSDFCLPYAIYIEMIYMVLIIIYVLAHRQMLKRAQYIIDLENRRQGIYKFSLSPINLALNIVVTGDTERELVNKSTEPLKEIIAFPGFKKANEYLKLNYFNTGDNIYNTYVAVETEVTALNKKYLYYGLLLYYLRVLVLLLLRLLA
jgi:hypothetical protein